MRIERAPTMEAFLAALPEGLGSYPDCQQKATVFRQFIGNETRRDIEAALPPDLIGLLESPPAPTEWISEVHVTAIYLAQRDSMASEDAFLEYTYLQNRRLLSSPLYRVLFAVAAPKRVLDGAAGRWARMHRGTELSMRQVEPQEAVLRLSGPPHLIPRTIALAYGTAYRAALELAGGLDVAVDCGEPGARGYTFRARWR